MFARSGATRAVGRPGGRPPTTWWSRRRRTARSSRSAALPDLLASASIDTVVVTGTVTNVCVEASVRDASTLDYRVILVADACAAMRDQDHNATLHVVYRSYGDVRSTAEVLDLIASG